MKERFAMPNLYRTRGTFSESNISQFVKAFSN